ncbi:hypothetical protein JR316_0005294 [Psilocybe cubensis]|uniref:Uncharacterized protein n=3 Tax=Psilocybe cubensis TaxID=181762 RepID=A0A8H7XIU9_PSICU|nr:hypothetical protein JR316_0005283 [Psilocybe cubensis]XP_047750815.1 hypothetical protein JR316_0005294 [Psilocybe cubensis]KAH9483179.1 hypothetical protein JR316_0005283 [Psilocybe cubensis]KAH9483190.1 hypothetical protein JR316_0005294 [Psilocybe cubensis]
MPYLTPKSGPSTGTVESSITVNECKTSDAQEVPAITACPVPEKSILIDTGELESIKSSSYPLVKLEVEKINDATAGRLATSLLGHVLFLKNQVPFPVMQLGRLPGGKMNTRAAKQRTELLASYDTISSHLDTTFSALSTALARCAGQNSKLAQVHLAILVGPSVTTAKSRLFLGIDGLEQSIWGVRDERTISRDHAEIAEDEREDVQADKSDEGDSVEDNDESDDIPEDSEDDDSEETSSEEESESESEEEENGDKSIGEDPPPPLYVSRAEELQFLQKAERLLSRTLAAADAEGCGISSELAPTQTHVLIRAPRRFSHPAWLPQQNVSNSLDTSLHDFLNNSGLQTAENQSINRPKHTKKTKVEGVWITTRQGIQPSAFLRESLSVSSTGLDLEDDEMIWWSWDGKFQGFSDW